MSDCNPELFTFPSLDRRKIEAFFTGRNVSSDGGVLFFEMKEAVDSVQNDHPIHWKEVVDDLIYTLNFNAELMPAEDHLLLLGKVMPFLMNVIAAMPLRSADKLLALHDAGGLEIIS